VPATPILNISRTIFAEVAGKERGSDWKKASIPKIFDMNPSWSVISKSGLRAIAYKPTCDIVAANPPSVPNGPIGILWGLAWPEPVGLAPAA